MKNKLIIITTCFISTTFAMNYHGPSLENISYSEDTRLVPYFPAHVRMVRLVNGQDRTDEAQMPAFFYREVILATYTNQPTPSEIAELAAHYQATHRLPDGTIRHEDGSVSSRAEFEQAIEKTAQEAEAIQQQIQKVAQGKDRVSHFLTTSRVPLLLAGGVMTVASIMRAVVRHPQTRFLSLTALTELPKAVYIIMLAGVAVKYVWQAAYYKWLTWSRNKALAAIQELRPRLDALEKLEHDKDRELDLLRSALAMHQKAELEARTQQDQAVQHMVAALQVQLDKLTQQLADETHTDESAHQQLRQELTDMKESLGSLRVSGQHQADTLLQIQTACTHLEAVAEKLKKR